MTNNRPSRNIILFGNRGGFSASVISQLIQDEASISQVYCAGHGPAVAPEEFLPVTVPAQEQALDTLASKNRIPVSYITNNEDLNSILLLEQNKPDFILVACFPYQLPESLIRWPRVGSLNIHPSLLPQYRGPDPLFWQLYQGETRTGVSLHLLSSRMDAGPVIAQKNYLLQNGATRYDLESSLAIAGAKLFTSLLKNNVNWPITGKPQDESIASYFPNPSREDYKISIDWNAKRTFNFIQGTCSPSNTYKIETGGHPINILSSVKYNSN